MVFAASESEDQPIDQDGILSITGGSIIAAGSSKMQGGVSAQTNQTAKIYSGSIKAEDVLLVTDSKGTEILNRKAPKAAGYIYLNHIYSFTLKINDAEVTLSEPTQSQQQGQGGQGDPNFSDGMGPGPMSSDGNHPGPGCPNFSDGMGPGPMSSDGNPQKTGEEEEEEEGGSSFLGFSKILFVILVFFCN